MPTPIPDSVSVNPSRTLVIEFSGHVTGAAITNSMSRWDPSSVELNISAMRRLDSPGPAEAALVLPTTLVDFAPDLFLLNRLPAARVRVEVDV